MLKFIKKNYLIILILLAGLFLRSWHPLSLFQYDHDHDLTGWFVRDILINHHLRLIGQETSSHGIFMGLYFYYLQIPFYILTRLDPSGSLLLPIILGGFAIYSIHFVFNKMFNTKIALIGALIYSLSVLIVFTDREVVPTMPVMLWSIWFLFALSRILTNKKNGYLLIGLLIGFIWSINLQLVILLPLVLLTQIFSKKKINFKEFFCAILIAIILNFPFVAFELRHGFQQTRSLFASLTTNKDYVAGTALGFLPKLDRTMQLVYKNTTNLFSLNVLNIDVKIMFWVLIFSGVFLILKKKIAPKLGVILALWLGIYILFFTKVSLNISEYYLNGMNIIYILIAAVSVMELIQNKKLKTLGCIAVTLFITLNLYSYFTKPVNANGYLQRKAILEYIKADSMQKGFPCVSQGK